MRILMSVAMAVVASTALAQPAQVIDANPSKGFNYPYILKVPEGVAMSTYLLVEPNNTGKVSDDFALHLDAAKSTAEKAIGATVSKQLHLPLMLPVFPRPQRDWQIYTHALDRDAMVIREGPLKRLDLQLLAMMDDARERLRAQNIETNPKVLMTGFSASGTFANRFTLLHPDRVQAVATGGVNGVLMVPSATFNNVELPYPLGIADFKTVTGTTFDIDAWRRVPQFIYMGAKDDNDAVQFDDGYSDAEKDIVAKTIGKTMQPDRWTRVQAIYRDAGANAQFRTYEGVGHWTDGKINSELVAFFAANSASKPPQIDGVLAPGEWDGAERHALTGKGEVLLLKRGDTLYVAVHGDKKGMASLCIGTNDYISVLHSSAALGVAEYEREGNVWHRRANFSFEVRDSPRNGPASQEEKDAFFERHGWISNSSYVGLPVREYAIKLTPSRRLFVASFVEMNGEDLSISYWPSAVHDDCAAVRLGQGWATEFQRFTPSTWYALPK